jgi:hypothetical protein
MRKHLVLVLSGLSLCSVLLLGCSDPYAAIVSEDFSIYLADPSYTVQQMVAGELDLDELTIDPSPILSLDDIISYTWAVHELEITSAARARMAAVDLGRIFVVTALDDRMYMGAFWEPTSSVAPVDISISKWHLETDDMPVIIWSFVEEGAEDMRADSKIRRVLEAAGKLQ